MVIIDREMTSQKITTDKSQTSRYCQASFNSEGHITIRNYDINNRGSDEIIIFSAEETQAIIGLFKRISKTFENGLPF